MDISSKRFRIRTCDTNPGSAQLTERGDPSTRFIKLTDMPTFGALAAMTEAQFDRAMEALL